MPCYAFKAPDKIYLTYPFDRDPLEESPGARRTKRLITYLMKRGFAYQTAAQLTYSRYHLASNLVLVFDKYCYPVCHETNWLMSHPEDPMLRVAGCSRDTFVNYCACPREWKNDVGKCVGCFSAATPLPKTNDGTLNAQMQGGSSSRSAKRYIGNKIKGFLRK